MTLQGGCPNLADCSNLTYFTYMINMKFPSGCNARWYAWSYRLLKCKVEWYLVSTTQWTFKLSDIEHKTV